MEKRNLDLERKIKNFVHEKIKRKVVIFKKNTKFQIDRSPRLMNRFEYSNVF